VPVNPVPTLLNRQSYHTGESAVKTVFRTVFNLSWARLSRALAASCSVDSQATTPARLAPARLPAALWLALALLVISVAINYVDRGNLSIAAPMLKDELGISPGQLGLLLSSFFWTYAAFQLVSGWLADRVDVNKLMAAGFLLWSLATAMTGGAHRFATLFLLRLILGIGESVAYPCYSKILAGYFPEHHRGLANSLIDAGGKVGPALGTLTGGFLMARFGWRPFFVVLGLGSLLWLPLWARWMPRDRTGSPPPPGNPPGALDILRLPKAWASFGGHFCGNYFWYFLLTWLPFYLVRERHFSMEKMASLGAMAYLVSAASTTITGWLADRAIRAGAAPGRVRRACASSGLAFATVIVGVTLVSSPALSMALLFAACAAYGVFTSSHWAITQTLAGRAVAGKWSGYQNGFANLAGVIAPAFTGFIVGATGHFLGAFAAAAVVALTGAALYRFCLGDVAPVDWDRYPR
jgi:MFS family permease